MKPFADVLAGKSAKQARRARPMPPPSLRAQTAGKSVYEVVAACRRACHEMQMELGDEPASGMLPAWERAHVPSDEDVAPYLAIVRRFGAKVARKSASRRVGLQFATTDHVARSRFAQGDDDKPADPTWLGFVLLGHLQVLGRPVRAQLPGGKMASRGAWRRAMAEVCRKPPMGYAKLSGAVVTALSRATRASVDGRCDTNYCADPAWGPAVLGFCNVSSKIHATGGCPACGR